MLLVSPFSSVVLLLEMADTNVSRLRLPPAVNFDEKVPRPNGLVWKLHDWHEIGE